MNPWTFNSKRLRNLSDKEDFDASSYLKENSVSQIQKNKRFVENIFKLRDQPKTDKSFTVIGEIGATINNNLCRIALDPELREKLSAITMADNLDMEVTQDDPNIPSTTCDGSCEGTCNECRPTLEKNQGERSGAPVHLGNLDIEKIQEFQPAVNLPQSSNIRRKDQPSVELEKVELGAHSSKQLNLDHSLNTMPVDQNTSSTDEVSIFQGTKGKQKITSPIKKKNKIFKGDNKNKKTQKEGDATTIGKSKNQSQGTMSTDSSSTLMQEYRNMFPDDDFNHTPKISSVKQKVAKKIGKKEESTGEETEYQMIVDMAPQKPKKVNQQGGQSGCLSKAKQGKEIPNQQLYLGDEHTGIQDHKYRDTITDEVSDYQDDLSNFEKQNLVTKMCRDYNMKEESFYNMPKDTQELMIIAYDTITGILIRDTMEPAKTISHEEMTGRMFEVGMTPTQILPELLIAIYRQNMTIDNMTYEIASISKKVDQLEKVCSNMGNSIISYITSQFNNLEKTIASSFIINPTISKSPPEEKPITILPRGKEKKENSKKEETKLAIPGPSSKPQPIASQADLPQRRPNEPMWAYAKRCQLDIKKLPKDLNQKKEKIISPSEHINKRETSTKSCKPEGNFKPQVPNIVQRSLTRNQKTSTHFESAQPEEFHGFDSIKAVILNTNLSASVKTRKINAYLNQLNLTSIPLLNITAILNNEGSEELIRKVRRYIIENINSSKEEEEEENKSEDDRDTDDDEDLESDDEDVDVIKKSYFSATKGTF